MEDKYDVAILGLGAHGGAAAYHLARRGARVIGFERFTRGHDRGSSHGLTRIIRKAYFEHPAYVPLLLRAYELWRDLERESGRTLLRVTGGYLIGRRDSPLVAGGERAAREHRLAFELVENAELRRRLPLLAVRPDEVGLFEPDAGTLAPEDCVGAHLELAERHGAKLRFERAVKDWAPAGDAVEVRLADGGSVRASQLVLAPGAWIGGLWRFDPALLIERLVICWFDSTDAAVHAAFRAHRHPVFIWDLDGETFYLCPAVGDEGAKMAVHHSRVATDPDHVAPVDAEDVRRMSERARRAIPGLDRFLRAKTCLYTTTADEHFILGRHPAFPQVLLASACSGHGFKFASVVGEILADLCLAGRTALPIEFLRPERPELRRIP
ncbi:MAG: N-methyl-L-tryptophan oxidase [Planctomycetes bacterium]|nr:N-methyl-L-tryptophan oxidase [Planctomycetota bacterium]